METSRNPTTLLFIFDGLFPRSLRKVGRIAETGTQQPGQIETLAKDRLWLRQFETAWTQTSET